MHATPGDAAGGGAGAATRLTQDLPLVAAAMAIPVVLYVVNPSWFYTPPGWLDSFATVGIGLNYADPAFANDYYKISRLPWNLLQFAARHTLSENAAQVVLHFSLLLLSTMCAARIGRNLFGRPSQFALMVLVTALPLLNAAPFKGGSDYQSAMAMPLFLGVVAALSALSPANIRAVALAAGVMLAALISVNPLYLQMVPCLACLIAAIALDRSLSIAGLRRFAGWSALGCAGCVAALMAIHAAFGRGPFYFLPEWRFIRSVLVEPSRDIWWMPLTRQAFRTQPHLGFLFGFAAVAAIDGARIVAGRTIARERLRLFVHIGFLIELTIWTWWQVFGHHTALLPPYFAHPLYGAACLSAAALIDRYVLITRPGIVRAAVLLLPLVTVLALTYSESLLGPLRSLTGSRSVVTGLGIATLYLALSMSRWTSRRHAAAALPLILAVLVLPFTIAATAPAMLYSATSCRLYPDMNRFLIESSRALARQVEHPADIVVWAAPGDSVTVPASCAPLWSGTVSDVADSFAAIGHTLLDDPWPKVPSPAAELPAARLRAIADRRNVLIAVLGSNRAAADDLRHSFELAGVAVSNGETLEPGSDAALPSIYLLRPEPRGRLAPSRDAGVGLE